MIGDNAGTEATSNQGCSDAIDLQQGLCCSTNHSCDETIGMQTGQWFEGLLGPLASTADGKANNYSTLYNRRYGLLQHQHLPRRRDVRHVQPQKIKKTSLINLLD